MNLVFRYALTLCIVVSVAYPKLCLAIAPTNHQNQLLNSLPSLPLKELGKIDMRYLDTLMNQRAINKFYWCGYAGLSPKINNPTKESCAIPFIVGKELFLRYALGKKWLFDGDVKLSRKYDFSNYLYYAGIINLICFRKNFLHELNLFVQKKSRGQRYYEQGQISYVPHWFISNGLLTFSNTLRGAKYIDCIQHYFFAGNSYLNFNYPSLVGTINCYGELLYQNTVRRLEHKHLAAFFQLSDFITVTDNIFLKPKLHYDTRKNKLGVGLQLGFFIKGATILWDFCKNKTEWFYFDTLYQNVYPILTNGDRDYPVCEWKSELSIALKNFKVLARYQQLNSFIIYNSQDTWLIPQKDNFEYQQFLFSLQNQWRLVKNATVLCYVPDVMQKNIERKTLVPNYILSESLQATIIRFNIGLNIFVSGKRTWDNQNLSGYVLFSSELGYNWKMLRILGQIENIFNNTYEILPNKLSCGRKFIIRLEYSG